MAIAYTWPISIATVEDQSSPITETEEAIKALKESNIRSEAYLSPLNGTSAKCSNGIPESLVTHNCLKTGALRQQKRLRGGYFSWLGSDKCRKLVGKVILIVGQRQWNIGDPKEPILL